MYLFISRHLAYFCSSLSIFPPFSLLRCSSPTQMVPFQHTILLIIYDGNKARKAFSHAISRTPQTELCV